MCPQNTVWNGSACSSNTNQSAQLGVRTETLGSAPNSGNCVLFARQYVPSLPYGLEFWSPKVAIINTNSPSTGSVAIIQVSGQYAQNGHVAIVQAVTSNAITILEAHYQGNDVTRRTATGRDLNDAMSMLNIRGFYRP